MPSIFEHRGGEPFSSSINNNNSSDDGTIATATATAIAIATNSNSIRRPHHYSFNGHEDNNNDNNNTRSTSTSSTTTRSSPATASLLPPSAATMTTPIATSISKRQNKKNAHGGGGHGHGRRRNFLAARAPMMMMMLVVMAVALLSLLPRGGQAYPMKTTTTSGPSLLSTTTKTIRTRRHYPATPPRSAAAAAAATASSTALLSSSSGTTTSTTSNNIVPSSNTPTVSGGVRQHQQEAAASSSSFRRSLSYLWRRRRGSRSAGDSRRMLGAEMTNKQHHHTSHNWTKQNLAIALPALMGLLADPVLSMVDTGFVGRLSGAAAGSSGGAMIDLAALGVCTSIFHMAFTIFRASTVATTSLIASAGKENRAEQRHIAKVSLQLAGVLGTAVLLGLRLGGPTLLATMGVPQGSPLYKPACDYLFARCWAAPAVVGIVVAEGVFRGNEDSHTPLIASGVAALLNLILDPLLMFRPLGMGMAGAAVATAISQLGAAGIYGWRLWRRKLVLPQPNDVVPSSSSSRTIVKQILEANVAMLAKQGSMLVFYTLATAMATRMGPVHVATHQIALSLFWLVTMWLDSGSISAQVLMGKHCRNTTNKKSSSSSSSSNKEKDSAGGTTAGVLDQPQSDDDDDALAAGTTTGRTARRSLTKYMIKYSLLQGLAFSAIVGGLGGWVPGIFTQDAAIQSALMQCLPHLAVQQTVVSLTLILEGLAIGGNQFRYMAAGTAVSTMAGIYQLSRATTVVGIWSSAVNTFFGFRLVNAIIGVARVHGVSWSSVCCWPRSIKWWKKNNQEQQQQQQEQQSGIAGAATRAATATATGPQ